MLALRVEMEVEGMIDQAPGLDPQFFWHLVIPQGQKHLYSQCLEGTVIDLLLVQWSLLFVWKLGRLVG